MPMPTVGIREGDARHSCSIGALTGALTYTGGQQTDGASGYIHKHYPAGLANPAPENGPMPYFLSYTKHR